MAKLRTSAVAYRVGQTAAHTPSSVPMRAKVFSNGRSQAVRLPKAMRVTCSEVFIRRDGNKLIMEPVPEPAVDAKGWPVGFWQEMDRLREGVDLDAFQIPDDPVPPPITPFGED